MTNTNEKLAIEVLVHGVWKTVAVERYDTIGAAQDAILTAITDCEGLTLRVGYLMYMVERGVLYRMTHRRGWQVVEPEAMTP